MTDGRVAEFLDRREQAHARLVDQQALPEIGGLPETPRAELFCRLAGAGGAADMGGVAHGAADIVAVRERADAGGERGGGAAAGPARRDIRAPRAERAPMRVVVGEPAPRECRRVGAPEDDRAGLLPVRD